MKQKGLAPLVIIILVALVLGGYLLYQKQINPVSQPSPTLVSSPVASSSADIANWKTYTNTRRNYSFRYPLEYSLKESSISATSFEGVSLEKDAVYQLGGGFADGDTLKSGVVFSFAVIPNKKLSEDALKNEYGSDIKVQKAVLDQKEVIEVVFPTRKGLKHVFYSFGKNVLDISINTGFGINNKAQAGYLADFNQILSTFRFLDQNQTAETANWKTYTNNKYSYSVKYPGDWFLFPDGKADVGGENTTAIANFNLEGLRKGMANDTRIDIEVDKLSTTFNDYLNSRPEATVKLSSQNITLDGANGVKWVYQGLGTSSIVYIPKNSYVYSIIVTYKDKEPATFNQILSTFKFLP